VNLVNEVVHIPAVIERVVHAMKPLADRKQLALEMEIAPDAGTILGDSRRVEQVLINLMSNAIKFTDRGQVRIECQRSGSAVVIRVRDTGIGIQKEDLDKLFRPFSQVDTGLTRQYEGTGLGLSISKKLVDLMGGTITVESEQGTGSTFTITLPADRGTS
jgi:signal transduction histidine kinase